MTGVISVLDELRHQMDHIYYPQKSARALLEYQANTMDITDTVLPDVMNFTIHVFPSLTNASPYMPTITLYSTLPDRTYVGGMLYYSQRRSTSGLHSKPPLIDFIRN